MNNPKFSTREVADALGVSESSARRLCDQGKISSVRTAGGHRKVSIDAIMSFVRETGHSIVRSDILGIAQTVRHRDSGQTLQEFVSALRAGDSQYCQSGMIAAYSHGKSLVDIFDQLISPAMVEIGKLWENGTIGVDQERQSCQIVMQGLSQIESCLPPIKPAAPTALGATPEGDFAQIGTKMAELVLRNSGWNARQMGSGVPLASLASACRRESPDLFWLSMTHLNDADFFVNQYKKHLEPLVAKGLKIVIGGRDVNETLRSQLQHTFYGKSMWQLEAYCQGAPRGNVRLAKPSFAASGSHVACSGLGAATHST